MRHPLLSWAFRLSCPHVRPAAFTSALVERHQALKEFLFYLGSQDEDGGKKKKGKKGKKDKKEKKDKKDKKGKKGKGKGKGGDEVRRITTDTGRI